MNRTTWIIIAVIVVLGLGGLIAFTKKDSVNVDNLDPSKVIQGENGSIGDRVYGKTDAKVVVFEYGDFQCPGCSYAHTATVSIRTLYKDKVAFVFRNLPLTTLHPNALAAATVAEAAGQQGKFWEMHDLLYEQRTSWIDLSADKRNDAFRGFAQQLGLDLTKFDTDQASAAVSDKISRDRAIASKLGIAETPTFYVGSTKADSTTANDVINGKGDKLMDMIDTALKAADETPPTRS